VNIDTGLSVAALRSCAVLLPVLLVGAFWVASSARVRGAAFLAMLWNFMALLLVNAVAVQIGWWSFGTTGTMWSSVPVDVVLGWSALWGALPILLARWVNAAVTVGVLIVADVLAMGSLRPLVMLEQAWWWGEVLAVVIALLPGLLLGMLTTNERALRTRAGMQVVLFGTVLVFGLPTVSFELSRSVGWSESGWSTIGNRVAADSGGLVDSLLLQLALVVVVIALRAVADFAVIGGGTPFPWDPPVRMVTTGPYAYVANPMQASAVVLLLILAGLFREPFLAAAAVLAGAFGAGLAAWHEKEDLVSRFGSDWAEYRRCTRDWMPRWTPTRIPSATLFASVTCDPCSTVGPWFARRRPVALRIAAAEDHSETLTRVRYEGAETLTGTRAIAAALEHVSLGWAVLGWILRAPILGWFLQMLVDAAGGAPRTVKVPD
jgi:protein-S-isoprenylcysteine O-methyltransferase Ste14